MKPNLTNLFLNLTKQFSLTEVLSHVYHLLERLGGGKALLSHTGWYLACLDEMPRGKAMVSHGLEQECADIQYVHQITGII